MSPCCTELERKRLRWPMLLFILSYFCVLGKGVNVILDCVGSSFWEQNIKSLAVDGRWVLYGLLGGGEISGNLLGDLLKKRGSLIATTLRSRPLSVSFILLAVHFKPSRMLYTSNYVRRIIEIFSTPFERIRAENNFILITKCVR